MKKLALIPLLITFNAIAQNQDVTKLDLTAICQGKQEGISSTKELVVIDRGFCAEFLKLESENQIKDTINALDKDKGINTPAFTSCSSQADTTPNVEIPVKKDQWKFRLYASHSYTTYFNSDISFRSTRYNVDIKDYSWAERSSREFFKPSTWKEPGNNPFQMIDEPSNTFTISMEKNGNEFFLQAFHPKFLQAADQVKYMKGEIDGTPVDGFAPVNKPFDGYDQVPGESELVGNLNTHRQMTFEAGYGHRFTLPLGKVGSFSYVPSIAVGVMVGNNESIMIKPNEWWEFDHYQDNYGIQGVGGSITNRFEFNAPKERFGIFYENKIAGYHQKHGFLDGTQTYNLGFMGNSIGMKFMIYNPKNHKVKVN